MEIGPLVSDRVLSLGPGHSLSDAARRMVERKVGSAVILADDGSPGIITERDILRALAGGIDADAATVAEFMTPDAITVSAHWDAKEAARRMLEGGFRHLVVLNDNGTVHGVLSIRDIARSLLEELETRD